MVDFRKALAEARAVQNGTTPEAEMARIDAEHALRAANHGYLPRAGIPFLHGEGIRTSCVTGERRPVHLVFEIVPSSWSPGKMVLTIAQGGVTGYESFTLDDRTLRGMSGRWPANVLTEGPGGWDGLEVSEEAMRTVREFISAHQDGPAKTAAIPQCTCS